MKNETLATDLRLTFLAATLLLAGCGPNPNMPMYEQSARAEPAQVQDNDRIQVTRIGVFSDDLAYSNRRGVYLIRDKTTGAEFIGVSGVGITEIARHACGKGCSREDER